MELSVTVTYGSLSLIKDQEIFFPALDVSTTEGRGVHKPASWEAQYRPGTKRQGLDTKLQCAPPCLVRARAPVHLCAQHRFQPYVGAIA